MFPTFKRWLKMAISEILFELFGGSTVDSILLYLCKKAEKKFKKGIEKRQWVLNEFDKYQDDIQRFDGTKPNNDKIISTRLEKVVKGFKDGR